MSKFQLLLLQSLRGCSLQSRKEKAVSKEIYDRKYWTLISDGLEGTKIPKFCAVCGESALQFQAFPDFENGSIVRAAYFCGLHWEKVKKIRTTMEDKLLYDIVKQLKDEE